MHADTEQLKRFLVDMRLVTEERLNDVVEIAAARDISLEDALISEHVFSEDDLRRAQAHVIGIPFVDLKNEVVDLDVFLMIPEPIARAHNVVAYGKTDNSLEVALLDIEDLEKIDFIKVETGHSLAPRLADTDSIKRMLRQYQSHLKTHFGDTISRDIVVFLDTPDQKTTADDPSMARVVETLIRHAVVQYASDIHIDPMEKELLVRYRIDGKLHDAMTLPREVAPGIAAYIKTLAHLDIDEDRVPQEGRCEVDYGGERVHLRVSTLPTHHGEKVVVRVLRESAQGHTPETLGLHGESLETLRRSMHRDNGTTLIAGSDGSGVSTTLYTLVDILNAPHVGISTIEDTIEYRIPRVSQTQVRQDGITSHEMLRALIRRDPDIIMIDAIDDIETATQALHAARSRYILAGARADSAADAVRRLLDMGVEPALLASSITAVVGQRLVRTLDHSTRERHALSKSEQKQLADVIDTDRMLAFLKDEQIVSKDATWNDVTFYRAKTKAEGDGFKGRTGIFEVLDITPAIKDIVLNKGTAKEIEAQAKKEGMMTMLEDGIFKAAQGITTIDEVLRVMEA